MNRNETKVWLNYHGSLFPEWREWFDGQSKEARAVFFESSAKALKVTALDEATEASDRMLAGAIKRPFRETDVIASVVHGAVSVRSQRWAQDHPIIDGYRTVSCPFCFDTGFVECWRVNLIDRMAVACSCPCGNGHTGTWDGSRGKPGSGQCYDPEKCYRVGDVNPKWLAIRERIESGYAPNYEPAFDNSKQ